MSVLLVSKLTKKGRRIGPRPPSSPGLSSRLLASNLQLDGIHRDLLPVLVPELELHYPIHQCEQRVIIPPPDIPAGVELGSPLPNQDVAGGHFFATIALHAQILWVAGPTVPAGAYAFFVCHVFLSPA